MAPEPVRQKWQQLHERIPEDPANTRIAVAERFQNVLAILGALNDANREIAIHNEVRELAGGRRAEVRVVYVGLAQAYYVSADGESGIGRPGPEGWKWEPRKLGRELLMALDIRSGTRTPEFVPLPVRVQ
jgi:hypothetical protein